MSTLSENAKKGQGKQFAGDFVLKEQQTGKGFSHVSQKWLDKTLSFDEMLKKGREFQARCKDIDGLNLHDLQSMYARIRITTLGEATPTEHAHKQMCSFLGLPAEYLSRLSTVDNALFDDNFNCAVDRANLARLSYDKECAVAETNKTAKPERPIHMDREVFLRLVEDKNGNSVIRAMLSSKYAVINNLPIIETLADILPGGRVSHLHYDGDTLRANILVPDCLRAEDDSDYGGGISVLNNETGRFMYRSRPFVFRAICMNGNIWDRADGVEFNRRHLGTIDWAEFRKQVVLNVQRQIPLVQANIEKVLALKGLPVTQQEIEQAIVYVGRKERLTLGQTRSWHRGWGTEVSLGGSADSVVKLHSAFGIVQGLTRGAQEHEFEAREMMETLSARLIDGNWDRVMVAARNDVSADEAKEVLAA